MGLFTEVRNLNTWTIVNAQQILTTIVALFSVKDKRTDLRLHVNYAAGCVLLFLFFPLQLLRKGLKKQQ